MTTLCPFCFEESVLRRRLQALRPKFPRDRKCEFHPTRSGLPAKEVADIVGSVIVGRYMIGEYEPGGFNGDRPEYVQQGQTLETIVQDLTGAQEDGISRAVVHALIASEDFDPRDGGEAFFHEDQTYVEVRTIYDATSRAWEEFKREILHNRRFFSDLAKDRLAEIFGQIDHQQDDQRQPVVYKLQPGDGRRIFRARQIGSAEERERVLADPANGLGTPPERLRSPGRMNPSGIAAFYGAFELDTCIAEIRPSIGSFVVGAAFELVRPLVVLDVTRFAAPIRTRSPFSSVYVERLEQWTFMQQFMAEISQPVQPSDTHLDYIPTQVVAEYISNRLEVQIKGEECRVDGIIFNSAQRPNHQNIVFFGDAAVVFGSDDATHRYSPRAAPADEISLTSWEYVLVQPALRVVPDTVVSRKLYGVEFQHEDSFERAAFRPPVVINENPLDI